MAHWRQLSNRELVRQHLRPLEELLEAEGMADEAKAIREACRRLMLPKNRREKPPERRPHKPRSGK